MINYYFNRYPNQNSITMAISMNHAVKNLMTKNIFIGNLFHLENKNDITFDASQNRSENS